MIEKKSPEISIKKQCELLGVSRSSYYYKKKDENPENLLIMKRIDELHLEHPAWGSRKLRDRLNIEKFNVNRKRIRRLMGIMNIQTIYPKKKLSIKNNEHKVYPYLLKNLSIVRINQVWCTDITYIRLKHGFVYLVAIMDWYSRKILSWSLSINLDKSFCIWALEEAIRNYGSPEIFNTDQGSQFTSPDFTGLLLKNEVKISMDGKGRALDNIMIERFWRSLKYEEVYLKDYETVEEAKESIKEYIEKYNSFRPHENLFGKKTPDMIYFYNKENCIA